MKKTELIKRYILFIVSLFFVALGVAVTKKGEMGVSLAVIADVIMNSGEAFVKALSDKFNKEFGAMKTAFDISCVVLAVVLSLVFFGFKIVGTREGTLIAALFTGSVVRFFCSKISKPVLKLIK